MILLGISGLLFCCYRYDLVVIIDGSVMSKLAISLSLPEKVCMNVLLSKDSSYILIRFAFKVYDRYKIALSIF